MKNYNSGFTLNLLTKDVHIANNLIKKYVKMRLYPQTF